MHCPNLTDYVLTEHALSQMQRRGIVESHVAAVLSAPEQRRQVRPGRCVYQSRLTLSKRQGTGLVRVFVDVDRDPPEVVTVYWTVKVQKYWR